MIGTITSRKLGKKLIADLQQELRDQGHYLTGTLERSMKNFQTENGVKVDSEVVALDYLKKLDEGVPGYQIDESDIAGLTRYAQLRFGKTGKAAVKAAIAIARAHRREGMPTKNSYQFSKNGERLDAIENSYDTKGNEKLIEQGISEEIDAYIDKVFIETIF